MENQNLLKVLSKYIRNHKGIECLFGHIDIKVENILGQGGNGIVFSGKINDVDIAIKFLLNYNTKKLERFKAEYLNMSMVKEQLRNVVNCLQYGVLIVEDIEFPYIIMKRYETSLKKYRETLSDVKWEDIIELFESLCTTLHSLETCKIIHRDLKPENILIDQNGKYIVSDFGISHFESEYFPIKNLTKKGERLANFEFSAPEQINGTEVSYATDIYSFAQILYWFAFGKINRGTGGNTFQELYNNEEAPYLNRIVYCCLNNNPKDRFQTINEIQEKILEMKSTIRKINPFDDMHELSRIVRSTIPEFYKNVSFTENNDEIKELVTKINEANVNRSFEFNTGTSNNTIDWIKPLENNHYLLNHKEIDIVRIWGYFGDSVYDDILIFETSEIDPYTINGKECYAVAVINNELIVSIDNIQSGYVRYKGKVYNVNDLEVEERYIYNDDRDKYYAIGAFHQCTIIGKNDEYINQLQRSESLDKDLLRNLKKNIRKNKGEDVYMYL